MDPINSLTTGHDRYQTPRTCIIQFSDNFSPLLSPYHFSDHTLGVAASHLVDQHALKWILIVADVINKTCPMTHLVIRKGF